MNLSKQTFDGIKWQVGANIAQKVISFCTTIILARYLNPAIFRLFAFVLVILGSFELFKSLGIDAAFLRRQENFDKVASTAFIIIPFLSIFLYLVLNF